jgi:hypothetical protein
MDVLQDFDFDSFLRQDGGVSESDFTFDTSAFLSDEGSLNPGTGNMDVPQDPASLQDSPGKGKGGKVDFDAAALLGDMDFANPGAGMDVLQDFDFDSFLRQDGVVSESEFTFDTPAFLTDLTNDKIEE